MEAQQAHLEIESFREERDDWRVLYETPEDRTRAEHAEHLSRTNVDARDLYERGATLYGDTLIIPREAHDAITSSEQIRIGTYTHAVREFTPLVGEQKAKETAKGVSAN